MQKLRVAEKNPLAGGARGGRYNMCVRYLLPLARLCVWQSISQLPMVVLPPLLHAVTARASHYGKQGKHFTSFRRFPTCLRSAQGCFTCSVLATLISFSFGIVKFHFVPFVSALISCVNSASPSHSPPTTHP